MAKNNAKNRNTVEFVILVIIIICIALVLFELYSNVAPGALG